MLSGTLKDLNAIKFPVLATPKLDGIRCLKIDGKALTRNFKPIPNHHIRNTIEKLCPDGFDGEIVSIGNTFNEVQSFVMTEEGTPNFQYVIFDYVKDDLNKSYSKRIEDLMEWLQNSKNMTSLICLFPQEINNVDELKYFETQALIDNYEGIMIRDPNGPYKCGRSSEKEGYLLKFKRFLDSEAVIIGFEEKMINTNESKPNELGYSKKSSHKKNLVPANTLGNLIVKDIKTDVVFSIGSGYNDELRLEIWTNQNKYLDKLVRYKYQPSGTKDKPRFPIFEGFRDERDL